MKSFIFVGLGGALGSMLRYLVSTLNAYYFQQHQSWATFFSNLLGCFFLGLFMTYFQKHDQTLSMWKLLLTTGFCGGFTTFSAFAFENITWFQSGQIHIGLLYMGSTLLVCLLAIWLGSMLIS